MIYTLCLFIVDLIFTNDLHLGIPCMILVPDLVGDLSGSELLHLPRSGRHQHQDPDSRSRLSSSLGVNSPVVFASVENEAV